MQNGRRYPSPERRISDPRQAIKGKWFPISWPNHLLRVYAGRGHGKRSSGYLFPLQGAGPGAVISKSVISKEPGARSQEPGEAPPTFGGARLPNTPPIHQRYTPRTPKPRLATPSHTP